MTDFNSYTKEQLVGILQSNNVEIKDSDAIRKMIPSKTMQQAAELLHVTLCRCNHDDGECCWYQESWGDPERVRWVTECMRMMSDFSLDAETFLSAVKLARGQMKNLLTNPCATNLMVRALQPQPLPDQSSTSESPDLDDPTDDES